MLKMHNAAASKLVANREGSAMSIRKRLAFDEAGLQAYLIEEGSFIRFGTLEDPHAGTKGRSSMKGPDGEQLTPDSNDGWFRGIHSGKRYKLATLYTGRLTA